MSSKDLPVEIVEQICDCLDRNSVFQLALVSRNCRNGAASRIFHTVSIRLTSRETFRESCEYADSVLASPEKSRQVRHLRVFGFMKGDISTRGDWDTGSSTRNRGVEIPGGVFTDTANCERLIRIMLQLETLRDFTWGIVEQIPSRVLRLLHESSPLTRLHMPLFCLKNLIVSPKEPIRIDPHELELATSPCLHSLGQIHMHSTERQGLVDYNASAVFEIVAGAAPNLRKVDICINPVGPLSGREWLPGTILKDHLVSGSHLEHLSISTLHHLTGPTDRSDAERMGSLVKLRGMMDISALRTLRIDDSLSASNVQWLTEECHFPVLESLDLDLWDVYNAEEMENRLNSFLLSLPPLRSLKLCGRYFPSTVPLVLGHSGRTLRRLNLPMPDQYEVAGTNSDPDLWAFADVNLIRMIHQRAPSVEYLALCIQRSAGDAKEVAVYRELGKLRSLRHLYLSVFHSADYLWHGLYTQQYHLASEDYMAESVDLVVSLAVDEALVGSIFHTIASAKTPHAAPLETLQYRVDALEQQCGFTSNYDWIKLLAYFARSLECSRNLRDDSPQQCFVEEYQRHWYQSPYDERSRLEKDDAFHKWVDEYYMPILQKVWPGVEGRDWMKKWHSFPLST
ncbi:hypothetical protein B0A48_12086 [Cryoendolithus antarcticus]|uniref:F-box domain-containing protein n=1 Tax=Cryoendolithus antarcticus TaxID=1507870 RepID=A0A1V8SU80_9PEZI|nr:hypothetical protein B0A48_12086 [Cryoendolithus antarcticus]